MCPESNLRTLKIRFHPTKDQITKFNKYFGHRRFIYNKSIEDKFLFEKTFLKRTDPNYMTCADFIKNYR